jgi:hypothetical protein
MADNEKSSSDDFNISHNDNTLNQEPEKEEITEKEDVNGRRKSFGLNIVENPLQVSFAISDPSQPPVVIFSIGAKYFHFAAYFQGENCRRCPCFR